MTGPVTRLTRTTALVLAALAAADGEVYGRQLAAATGLPGGTLYMILARLERGGWLSTRWEAADPRPLGRPLRRYVKLTPAGRAGVARLAGRLPQVVPGVLLEIAGEAGS